MKNLKLFLSALFFLFAKIVLSNGIGVIDAAAREYLTNTSSQTTVVVNSQIAVITTTQNMVNYLDRPVVFRYAFPLGEKANPASLRWNVRGVWKEAGIGAKSQNNSLPGGGTIDPTLQQYLGETPLFFSPKDTLAPGESIVFELIYVELLPYFLGEVSFNYKGDLTGIQSEKLESNEFEFILNSEREILKVDLLDQMFNLDINPNKAVLKFLETDVIPDINFNIVYELSSLGLGVIPLSTYIPDSLVHCDEYGQGFVTFIIEPESNVNTEVIDKNFTLIIDRSGSMNGNKIVQARDAASFIVENLNLGDFFNVIDFSSDVRSLFPGHREYTVSTEEDALQYIRNLRASGGTNISGALSTAIRGFEVLDPDKANIILFFTDGKATSGVTGTNEILEIVEEEVARAETSVFLYSIGIGQGADKRLLTLLAQSNNGEVSFIEDNRLEEDISRLFLSINNPVLINTKIEFIPSDVVSEITPFPFPNLYKGQQLIVSGRYQEVQDLKMTISGQAFNVPTAHQFDIELADTSYAERSILPKVWAKQRIDELLLEEILTTSPSVKDSIGEVIDSISICYGVVSTGHTSFEDNNPVSVSEEDIVDDEVQIFVTPNPFTDRIEITIKEKHFIGELLLIELRDASGRVVRTYRMTGEATIRLDDLEAMAPGAYHIVIKSGNSVYTGSIVKVAR